MPIEQNFIQLGTQQHWTTAGDWGCSECGTSNFARRGKCFKCGRPRLVLLQATLTSATFVMLCSCSFTECKDAFVAISSMSLSISTGATFHTLLLLGVGPRATPGQQM